jgi:hypothetical protein
MEGYENVKNGKRCLFVEKSDPNPVSSLNEKHHSLMPNPHCIFCCKLVSMKITHNRKHKKSATTINSEINAHPEKFDTRILVKIDPGKTRKGKTSERGEAFIIQSLERNLLQQSSSTN